MDQVVFIEFIL